MAKIAPVGGGGCVTLSPDDLKARIRAQYGDGIPARSFLGGTAAPADQARPAAAPVGPITLRIPWSALVSDNDKYAPAMRAGKPVIILTERYRTAKAAVAERARDAMAGRLPLEGPLAIHARVFVPNGQRRDSVNFSKCAQDALSKIVYSDDTQLHDVRWTRAGVDVDAPRAEIVITPIPSAS